MTHSRERPELEGPQIVVNLYDGAECLLVERSAHGNYCDFRIIRQDFSTLLVLGGYAQRVRVTLYGEEGARLSVGDSHIGLMTLADGESIAAFLGIEARAIEDD